MLKTKILALAAAAALAWLALAPAKSEAQNIRFGISVPGVSAGFSTGYGRYGTNFGYNRYYPSQGFGYSNYGYGYNNYYPSYGYRAPTVVHPEVNHWTPYRGWHTHGHVHVPHGGHYHTLPY